MENELVICAYLGDIDGVKDLLRSRQGLDLDERAACPVGYADDYGSSGANRWPNFGANAKLTPMTFTAGDNKRWSSPPVLEEALYKKNLSSNSATISGKRKLGTLWKT